MEIYTKNIEVVASDLDDLNHVNNVRYVQWMQDIAKEHWQSRATQSMQDQYAWVVLKHTIAYKGAAKLHETLLLKTYIARSKGPISVRVVEMSNATSGQLLVQAETEWCLLNSKSLKPVRISNAIKQVFSNETASPL
ncbi:acyl-CoA thioesterase [Spongiimicrobium salis]|uniref:acyl-CoA thioesterase n=1 Tax=Spongiimicrobium salis TaxID=1667022 RepID=UPI00374DB835